MTLIEVQIFRVRGELDADLPLPDYATSGSAGVDLRAAVEKDLTLDPGQRLQVPTGFALAIPEGYEAQIRPRSGLALRHGIRLPNAPGTIDSDYRGEVQVILENGGNAAFEIHRGDRIAQLVVSPIVQARWSEVTSEDQLGETSRGAGGFGSTGTK